MKTLYIILFLLAAAFTGAQAQSLVPGTNVIQGPRVIQGTKIGVMTTTERDTNLSPSTMTAAAKTALRGVAIFNTDTKQQEYWDGTKWVGTGQQWFYMPSFNLDVTATGTGKTIDLYAEYKKQFTKSGNTQFVSSNATVATAMPMVYTADKLDYFVTAYPASVLKINSISAAGVMNYDVLSTNVPEGSFINVVFAVK